MYILRVATTGKGGGDVGMKRAHEGLNNYLKSLRGPGEVASPAPSPRLPVGPDAPLPIGLRPIPTSSQRPKPTNATIVYARTAIADCNGLGQSQGAPPVALSMAEGDVVLTHRMAPATRAPLGQNVKVISLRLLNQDLQRMGPMAQKEYEATFFDEGGHFKWCPDGVVNNLDGADPANEFRDFAIANVALQGFVRFSTLPFGEAAAGHAFPSAFTQKGVRNGDHVYLAFARFDSPRGKAGEHDYRFGLVLASQITNNNFKPGKNLLKAWSLGRVVDGNQSNNMVTLCVGVAPVAPEAGMSADQVLLRKWLDGRDGESKRALMAIERAALEFEGGGV